MGLLNKLFGNEKEVKEVKQLPWIPLVDLQQLDLIEENSMHKKQIIFKHSTRCHISRMVSNQFIEMYSLGIEDADLYYLDLLAYRAISNAVAERFQVYHESPQLLVIKNGKVLAHASHGAINAMNLNDYK